jgi:hypothetical protein
MSTSAVTAADRVADDELRIPVERCPRPHVADAERTVSAPLDNHPHLR